MSFKDKIVLITGAAGGVGTALTHRFLAEGCSVCAVDTTQKALDVLINSVKDEEKIISIVADISSEADCDQMYQKVKETWVTVDILINNAGWFPFTAFEEVTYEEWRKVVSINLDGTFLVTKAIYL